MLSEDKILLLVKEWDAQDVLKLGGDNENIPLQGTYRERFDYIRTLANYRFVPYLNDEVQDFFGKFWGWLSQFETDDERRLAFKIASRITFITEDQIRHLQEVSFQEKLQFRLLDEIVQERNLSPFSYIAAKKYFPEKLHQCLIVPLTDSARYNQFMHVNNLENHSNLGLRSVDVLVHPDIRSTPDAVKKLNLRYQDKRILVVLEDFCGSGKTFTSDLARIANLYKGFEKIFFCPYIITERAEKSIDRFARLYIPHVQVEILYGMRVSNRLSVFSRSSDLFSYDKQQSIRNLCVKYHRKYFSDHKFIGTPRTYPFGYRNGQLLIVMQSNCPNHTLPIIWAHDKGWQPLFRRVQRYA